MTEHAGPVARIMPRTRSTYSKYFNVPESVRELPFLPSVESAYDQGFRRMVLYANYSEAELYLAHPDVLFIGSTWGSQVMSVHLNGTRVHSRGERDILEQTIAIVAVTALSSAGASIRDLYPRLDNQYAQLMQRGAWQFNGDAIRLTEDGSLLDGQHRLSAIAKSGTTQRLREKTQSQRRHPRPEASLIFVGELTFYRHNIPHRQVGAE